MHDEKHKLKIRIETPKCGDESCDCAGLDDHIEGTVQEVIQGVYDDSLVRDTNLMEIVADLTEAVVALYQVVESIAPHKMKLTKLDDGGFNGRLH